MNDAVVWDYYQYKRYLGRIKYRISGKYFSKYASRRLLNPLAGNDYIKQMIVSGNPFAVCRFGLTELSAIAYREGNKLGRSEHNNDSNLCALSGFFPNNSISVDRFSTMMIAMISEINLLGVWYNRAEEYIVHKYMPDTAVTNITSIEPYIFDSPWSAALEGKKVLVIHPFEESIIHQWKISEKLFDNPNILPYFELKTIKAVQTLSEQKDERFNDWFEALQYMKNQMDQIEYDVAIIGCGAYGMPLAIHAKQMGKQAIHMGGATQILFGIKGQRWDNNPIISNLYNEYWIRPSKNESVKQQEVVEGGCYW